MTKTKTERSNSNNNSVLSTSSSIGIAIDTSDKNRDKLLIKSCRYIPYEIESQVWEITISIIHAQASPGAFQ